MSQTWLRYLTFTIATCIVCSGNKGLGRETCVFVDYVENDVSYDTIECSTNRICQRHFQITYINVLPYVYSLNTTYWGIDEILLKCCGPCVKYTSKVLGNITELTVEEMAQSDFVFPILSRPSTRKLYGSHYLPYIRVPSVIYITKNHQGLFRSLLNCYPIVVLCLLLSVVSGFVAWLFETWGNEREFPRPFLIGCFEGFWWAFVSMTTVGYGDKTPKSIGARLFSIVWIMIGIIGFGILTGQLTGEIVKSNSPPPASMKDRNVGVLRFRDHDTLAIVEKEGKVVRNTDEYSNVTDFYSDVSELLRKLQRDEISGFVLDKWTLAYVMLFGEEFLPSDLMTFFISQTTRTEEKSAGEPHSYGILIREDEVFQYFEEYVRDAQDRWAIISEEWWAREKKKKFGKFHSHTEEFVLSPSQPFFKRSLMAVVVMIGVTMFFGLLCEIKRKTVTGRKKHLKNIPI